MAYRGLSRHLNFELPAPGDRFVLQDLIGEGTYGEVFSARDNVTGKCKTHAVRTHFCRQDRLFGRFLFYFVLCPVDSHRKSKLNSGNFPTISFRILFSSVP
jgi:serine/threonine protein kinase